MALFFEKISAQRNETIAGGKSSGGGEEYFAACGFALAEKDRL
jgi:hypothetical protein